LFIHLAIALAADTTALFGIAGDTVRYSWKGCVLWIPSVSDNGVPASDGMLWTHPSHTCLVLCLDVYLLKGRDAAGFGVYSIVHMMIKRDQPEIHRKVNIGLRHLRSRSALTAFARDSLANKATPTEAS
jgi:hypothetical protein